MLPPSDKGAIQETVTEPKLDSTILKFYGTSGTIAAKTVRISEKPLVPTALIAVTLK